MITREQVFKLFESPEIHILETRAGLPKVIETKSNEMVKIFYPKKWPSSSCYHPYALRFSKNASYLKTLGLNAPEITSLQYCPEMNTYLLRYPKIPGENLLSLCKTNSAPFLENAIKFISLLHQKGIYFRAIHLSNLLYQAPYSFALIDITDMKFTDRALSLYLRMRNLKKIFNHHRDRAIWQAFDVHHALSLYSDFANLSSFQNKILKRFLLKEGNHFFNGAINYK